MFVVVRTAADETGFTVDGTGFADVVWDKSAAEPSEKFGNGMFTAGFVTVVGGAEAG